MTAAPWFVEEKLSSGTIIAKDDHSTHIYTPGGPVERVLGSIVATREDPDLVALISASDPTIITPGPAYSQAWLKTQRDFDIRAGSGSWPPGTRYSSNLYLAWQRNATAVTLTADATIWFSNLVVFLRRYNYASGLVDTVTNPTLTVEGIVHDLMGRGVNSIVEFDPNRVDPGTPWTTVVPHAAWWDGVSARDVLALCTTYAPGMWWTVGAPGPSGLPKFTVGQWDGPVRYVFARGTGDVELSGGAADLANRALVRYVGTTYGNTTTTWVAEVRANVRGLAEAGAHRTMMVDITGEGLTTTKEARRRGVAALCDAALSKTAGRVTVRAPVMDLVLGRMVEPWEMVAGSPVIVSDAPLSFSRSTSLAESVGADGVSVFRTRGVAFDASSNSAVLTLDGGSRSLIGRMKVDTKPRRYENSTVQG